MASAWMNHVKAVRKQNPKKSLKEVLKMASNTYKKSGSSTKKVHKKPSHGKKTARRGRKSRGSKSRGRGRK